MFSERQKRDASLGVLEKLRSKGMPSRPEEDVESMFEVAVNDTGTGTETSPEDKKEKEKKKKKAYERGDGEIRMPAANQPAARQIMKSFGR
jgi:hypothetical protein